MCVPKMEETHTGTRTIICPVISRPAFLPLQDTPQMKKCWAVVLDHTALEEVQPSQRVAASKAKEDAGMRQESLQRSLPIRYVHIHVHIYICIYWYIDIYIHTRICMYM